MGEILQERNTRTSDFESNPLYSLTIESGVTPKTDRYERSSLVTKTEDLFKIVKPNEFVTNPMNLRFGALGYNRNAFTVSVSGYYDVFSIDDDKCSGFWNSYFKTLTAMNIFDNAATGSLIEKRRVKYSTLQQLAFYMPNDLSEKAEIGKYMDTFDNLITLHQRKLELRFFPGCMFFIWVRMLTWCPETKEQGIAGSEAPRPTGRSPILSQRRGTRRRKNKALGGAKHHVQPAEIRFCSKDVVPGDERTRHWGERSTTPNRPKPHFVPKTWYPTTKEQGIGGSEAPRPTGRSPILSQRRGARRRKNKALGGAKHHA